MSGILVLKRISWIPSIGGKERQGVPHIGSATRPRLDGTVELDRNDLIKGGL